MGWSKSRQDAAPKAANRNVGAASCRDRGSSRLEGAPIDRIRAGATQDADELERLRETYVSAMSRLLTKWDRRDHWLLRIGFAAFVLAAATNVARLGLAD